jgi:hypothetical protein
MNTSTHPCTTIDLAERAEYEGTNGEGQYIDTESHGNESLARDIIVKRDIGECRCLSIEISIFAGTVLSCRTIMEDARGAMKL